MSECRVPNNKIKHLGVVDRELASFPTFAALGAKAHRDLALDLQRYSGAVFEFIGEMMEQSARLLDSST